VHPKKNARLPPKIFSSLNPSNPSYKQLGGKWRKPMLSKCANPSCSTPLIYLREGKIFMLEAAHRSPVKVTEGKPPSNVRQIEHFWLCGACSARMTLVYDKVHGLQVRPKPRGFAQAAS
jgi:hypothetical protein